MPDILVLRRKKKCGVYEDLVPQIGFEYIA